MLGNFGFSYIGLIYLLMLWIPNAMWAKHKPEGYDLSGESKVLLAFKRVGQVLSTAAISDSSSILMLSEMQGSYVRN